MFLLKEENTENDFHSLRETCLRNYFPLFPHCFNDGCVTNGFLKGEFTWPSIFSVPFGENHMVDYLGKATFD